MIANIDDPALISPTFEYDPSENCFNELPAARNSCGPAGNFE